MTTWLAALVLDARFGEPPAAVHPVVWMGRMISWLEARAPRSVDAQLVHGSLLVVLPAICATALGHAVRLVPRGPIRAVASAALLKTAFSLRALLDASRPVEYALDAGDHATARESLLALVGRERDQLDEPHIASAAIESLAENLTDSYVAPLLAYSLAGLPAALAYRAVNTADAMVGHRGPYEHLGKASARLDDVLNLAPARLAALAMSAAAKPVGLDVRGALARALRDSGVTASPNAGWTMAAASGALGTWLEKPGHYRLGGGRAPGSDDIARARELVLTAALLTTIVAVVVRR